MKKLLIVLINVVIIIIVLCNYHTNKVVADPGDDVVTSSNDVEFVDINVTYEEDLGKEVFNEVQKAISMMPPDVVRSFANDKWKIVVTSDIDLTDTEFEDTHFPKTVGLTDMQTKTIQVSPAELDSLHNFVKIKTLHELCHYADIYYDNAADSDEFRNLYTNSKDYVEYEYKGVKKTESNKIDIDYATSDRYEFFACAMKDYLNQPEYLKLNYPNIYDFFAKLIEK